MGFDVLLRRLALSLFVRPTIQGGVSIVQSCGLMACFTGGCIAMGWTGAFIKRIPFSRAMQCEKGRPAERLLFLRVIILPSLFEEVFWRVILQPPSSSAPYILWINSLFALSHMIYAPVMRYMAPSMTRSGRVPYQVPPVFSDLFFVAHAFVLGNLCSYTYRRAGFALWAPVLLHAITVTVWLSHFCGNEALGRGVAADIAFTEAIPVTRH